MSLQNGKAICHERKGGRNGLVAVAIDKDKSSPHAIKWATENLLTKGQTVILIHVLQRSPARSCGNYANGLNSCDNDIVLDKPIKDIFFPFHCFCIRKDIQYADAILEDMDIAKAITEYIAYAGIETLVLGASHHGFLRRLNTVDIPTRVSKASPEFCTVYVISKSKISSIRNASWQAPFASPLLPRLQQLQESLDARATARHPPSRGPDKTTHKVIADEADISK